MECDCLNGRCLLSRARQRYILAHDGVFERSSNGVLSIALSEPERRNEHRNGRRSLNGLLGERRGIEEICLNTGLFVTKKKYARFSKKTCIQCVQRISKGLQNVRQGKHFP